MYEKLFAQYGFNCFEALTKEKWLSESTMIAITEQLSELSIPQQTDILKILLEKWDTLHSEQALMDLVENTLKTLNKN